MTVDVDSLARFLQNGLASAATSIVTMVAIAAAMFWLDPILALTALSAVPVVMLATWIYRRLSSPAYAQARLEIGKVNSTLQEKVSGMRVVQSHGQQKQEAARLRALSDNFRATPRAGAKIPCRLFSVPDLLHRGRLCRRAFNRGDPGRRRRNDARDTGGVLPAIGPILWPGTAVVRHC